MPEANQQILVVDDVEENRDLLKRRLERRGYAVVVAESGQGALDIVAKGGIDLVLLDIMMPGMSGLETLERLRRDSDQDRCRSSWSRPKAKAKMLCKRSKWAQTTIFPNPSAFPWHSRGLKRI